MNPAFQRVVSVITAVLGVAVLVSTFAAGGGPLAFGTLAGVALIALGLGRLYLAGGGARR